MPFNGGPSQVLDNSMIMHQIINSFQSDTSWLLNLLFQLFSLFFSVIIQAHKA